MKTGRPSTYDPKYIAEVDRYLETKKDKKYKRVKSDGEKSTSWEHKIKVSLPTLDDFAMFIGVPRRTLYEWRDDHEEFSHSLEKIVAEQKRRVIESGLSGDYNPLIAKLVLSANHGMAEKTEVDHRTMGESIKQTPEEAEEIRLAKQQAVKAYEQARKSQLKKTARKGSVKPRKRSR